jgi:hypothetical protein
MMYIYSEIHKNIQNKFNRSGVEILSPLYGFIRDRNESAVTEVYNPED